MAVHIEIVPPKHDPQLLSAVEQTLRAHSLRLKPGQTLEGVAEAVTEKGFKLTAANGYLCASQVVSGFESPCHVNTLFESLAEQQPERFFPRNVDGVSHN
jgi:hypothetical protein